MAAAKFRLPFAKRLRPAPKPAARTPSRAARESESHRSRNAGNSSRDCSRCLDDSAILDSCYQMEQSAPIFGDARKMSENERGNSYIGTSVARSAHWPREEAVGARAMLLLAGRDLGFDVRGLFRFAGAADERFAVLDAHRREHHS